MPALVALMIAALLAAAGCTEQRSRQTIGFPGSSSTGPELDAGTPARAVDRVVPSFCLPGALRCLAESSPVVEVCREDGTGFDLSHCRAEEICREGRCVPFTCTPGRPLCVGTTTRAVCDATGRATADISECPETQTCVSGACTDPCAAAAASASYIGCEYTAIELPNLYNQEGFFDDSPFAVVVANTDPLRRAVLNVWDSSGAHAELRTSVDLDALDPRSDDQTVASEVLRPNALPIGLGELAKDIELPPLSAAVLLLASNGDADVFQIKSSLPVVAYQFSPYCCNFTATNDASLLLPKSTWGKRYRVVGYPTWALQGEIRPYVAVVAREDATEVTVDGRGRSLRRTNQARPFTTSTFTLNAGERVLIEPSPSDFVPSEEEDLSGISVEADKPVGAFTGHPCTFVPSDKWACDHLEEQLPPASTLGDRYLLVPTRERGRASSRTEATYWRVVADEDLTLRTSPALDEILVFPPSSASPSCLDLVSEGAIAMSAGDVCEFGTRTPVGLHADGALVVAGVISGHESTGIGGFGTQAGDPSLFIVPPVGQFRRQYSFVSAPTFKRSYVSVVAPLNEAVALDGRNIVGAERLERTEVTLDGRRWEVFAVALDSGIHRIESEEKFGIVVYAYDDYVSYAFTGGLDLLPKGAE